MGFFAALLLEFSAQVELASVSVELALVEVDAASLQVAFPLL